jgi:hypothetical protein
MKVPRNTEFKKEVMLCSFPVLSIIGSELIHAVVAHGTELVEVPAFHKIVLKVRIPLSMLRTGLWLSNYFTDLAVMVPKICDNGNLNTSL